MCARVLKNGGSQQFRNIQKEKTQGKNQCYAFLGCGNYGEQLALHMFPKSIGSGSKGGCASDNREYEDGKLVKTREIKCISLEGTKSCKKCEQKAPRFQEKCWFCDGNKFTLKPDSRFAPNAKTHFESKKDLKLEEYILIVSKFNEKNRLHQYQVLQNRCS